MYFLFSTNKLNQNLLKINYPTLWKQNERNYTNISIMCLRCQLIKFHKKLQQSCQQTKVKNSHFLIKFNHLYFLY